MNKRFFLMALLLSVSCYTRPAFFQPSQEECDELREDFADVLVVVNRCSTSCKRYKAEFIGAGLGILSFGLLWYARATGSLPADESNVFSPFGMGGLMYD